MRLNNEKGIAFVVALFFVVILYGLAGTFILTTVTENNMARYDRENTRAFYAANGGGQMAVNQLNTLINTFLWNTISNANPSGVISFATSQVAAGDGVGWLVFAVRDNNVPVLTQNGEQAEYTGNGTIGNLNYQYMITMTEKSDPVTVNVDTWDFPFSFILEAGSTSGGVSSNVTLSGDFTVRLQRDNFAKFALFTNSQTTPGGTNVWFTDKTNFAGPVHTNARFNIALNPSGTFQEIVTQQDQFARFYNWGAPILLDADFNGTRDVPAFYNGFNRNVSAITLNSSTSEQDMVDQAAGGQVISSPGIYIPNDGTAVSGGILAIGNSNIALSVDGSNRPVYTVTQGTVYKAVTVDSTNLQTTVYDSSDGSTQTYSGIPDGVDDVGTLIYVDGAINNFSGVVQADSQVTVASKNDIIISDHVRYENYTPAVGNPGDAGYVPPTADGTANLLGVVTWQGDVRIGTAAPDNVDIHGTILASSGILQVDNYNDQGVGPRGTATLLGGVISDNYGAFGLFNGGTGQQVSGYGRNFVYDQRMQLGQAPPYFPSLNTFIAFTNDITDKIVWQEGD